MGFEDSLRTQITATLSGTPAAAPPASSPPSPSASPVTPVAAPPASTPPVKVNGAAPVKVEATPEVPAVEEPSGVSEPADAQPPAHEDPEEFRFPDEKPATPEAEAAEQAEYEKQLGDLEGLLPKEVIDAHLKTARGKRLYEGYRLSEAARKPPEEGGLGFVPSIEDLKTMNTLSSDFGQMTHEFLSGDPVAASNWAANWFGSKDDAGNWHLKEGVSPEALKIAAANLIPTLDRISPDLVIAAARPVMNTMVEQFYQYAVGTEDQAQRIKLLHVAREMESYFNGGKFRPIPKEWVDGAVPQPDPQAQQLDARVKYINDFQQNQQRQAYQAFESNINTTISSSLQKDSEVALDSLKAGMSDRAFKSLVRDFQTEVSSSVNGNKEGLRNFYQLRDLALRAPTPENVEAAAKAWNAVARSKVRALRLEYIKDNAPALQAASQNRHAVLAEASQKTGAGSAPAPNGKDFGATDIQKLPGESYMDFLKRKTRSAMTKAG